MWDYSDKTWTNTTARWNGGKEICEVDMTEGFPWNVRSHFEQELLAKSCHARHHLCLGFDPADSDFETSPTWPMRPKHLRSELGKKCILAARAVETFMRLQTDRMMIHKLHNCTKIRSRSQDVKRGEGIECESLSIQLPMEVPLGHHLDITWTSLGYHMLKRCHVLPRVTTEKLVPVFWLGLPERASGPSEQNQRELNSEHLRTVIRWFLIYMIYMMCIYI